jgi:hypothetical protein
MKDAFKIDKPLSESLFWAISAIFSFGFYFCLLIIFRILQPDLDEHIVISENMFTDWHVPAHPMFYFLVQLLSFFSKNMNLEIWAAFFIFSFAQLLKIRVSKILIEEVFNYRMGLFPFLMLLLAQLVISVSIFESKYIVDQISPNYFHNGTLQLSLPFALLLFLESWRFQKGSENYSIRGMLFYGILVCLSKPSFLFCFIPMFPTYILYTKGIGRKLLSSLQVSTLFTFFIIGQSFYLRLNPPNYVTSFKVLFMPFYQFGDFRGHISMIFYGCFLIILTFAMDWKFVKEELIQFLVSMLVLAYLISFLFVDMINGDLYSNMTWQASVVIYILLIVCLGRVFKPGKDQSLIKKGVFSIAIAFNVVYTFLYLFHAIGMRTLFV